MPFQVNLEQLLASAAHVAGHGEDLATRHLAADNRIESATPGWTGRSAEALANRASLWTMKSTSLVTRVGEHAGDLHVCMQQFATMEKDNAQALS
ncbi:WXG100 family type VII secretion target [Mycobacterium sp.]|uniref:WXG100 family type VII secretion target n=1 Tax=Mycobacterium sp. TaxID=1785 RepID=UPI003D6C2D64